MVNPGCFSLHISACPFISEKKTPIYPEMICEETFANLKTSC